MDEVKADYEQLSRISTRFDEQHSVTQQLLQRVDNHLSQLRAGSWRGGGAKAFYGEMEGDVLPAIVRLRQALEQAMESTIQIRDILLRAEEEASDPFSRIGV